MASVLAFIRKRWAALWEAYNKPPTHAWYPLDEADMEIIAEREQAAVQPQEVAPEIKEGIPNQLKE